MANYNALEAALAGAQSGKAFAQTEYRAALSALETLERDAFNIVDGKPSYEMSKDQKRDLLISFGFASGKIGEVTDEVRKDRANKILANAPTSGPFAGILPPALLDRITAERARYGTNEGIAGGGSKEVLTAEKNTALELVEKVASRIRFHYCESSDDLEYTKELSEIGLQPKRLPGIAAAKSPDTPPSPAASV